MKGTKLLYVISTLNGSGGAERALTNRVNFLVEHYDYDITIVTTSDSVNSSFYPLNKQIKLIHIPIVFAKKSFFDKLRLIFPSSYIEEKPLLDFVNRQAFDICTSFGSETFLYKEKGYRDFIKIKENRFTYKKLLTDEKLPVTKRIWRAIRFRNSVSVQSRMDYVITLTEEDADFWRKYLKKVLVFPNFISTDKIIRSNLQEKSVIAVGRLEKEKDYHSMIQAFEMVRSQFPEWKLNIYGEGSLRNELQNLIKLMNLEQNVFLRGSVNNIFSKLETSSIFLMTSEYEGFPNAMLEGMAHGLPIVAFESVGGVKVLVSPEENGFLVKNRNILELASKIKTLISDESLRETMGMCSVQLASGYDKTTVMEKWHEFYSGILKK